MLTDLNIRNLAVVQQAELQFEQGLTTLTGETGAGKSIIIQSLLLVLGERASSETVRAGESRGEITALFDLTDSPQALQWLKQHELDTDDECQLRRTVNADGRSRSYINGNPTPAGRVRELGALLMDIHGQHEYQQLLKGDAQRALLDSFAGLDPLAGQVRQAWQQWHDLDDQYRHLAEQQQDQSAQIELLTFQLDELQTLSMSAQEWSELQQEHQRAKHSRDLVEGCRALVTILDEGDSNISAMMTAARQQIDPLREIDTEISAIGEMVEEADILVSEILRSLNHYADGLELDPQRLSWLEERISSAIVLARKHHCEPTQLADQETSLQTQLDAIEQSDDQLKELQQKITLLRADYDGLANELTEQRTTAAALLSEDVSALLKKLGMNQAQLIIQLDPRADDQPHADGMEKVSCLFSANPGMQPGPMGRIASGGELSRISLALQVCAKGQSAVPTLVFDEVDVGVGGAVAEIVGQLLSQLGHQRQVFCITHLPQVAAQGQQQLKISKRQDGQSTATAVEPLDGETRVTEIARMLAGIELTEESMAHARQMLAGH